MTGFFPLLKLIHASFCLPVFNMYLVDSIHDQRRVCGGELWSLLAV